MDTLLSPNDISAVVEADRAHIWHHLSQHKQYETVDPRVIIEGRGLRVWVRVREGLPEDPRVHQMALAYLSDLTLLAVSVLGHPVQWASPGLIAASIDHSMWFHRPARADEWLLYDQWSPSASSALGFSLGRLFQDGAVVASCAQEGLVRVQDA